MSVEERTFLTQGNIAVTSARLVIGAETYAMGTINSVKISEKVHVPSKLVPILCGGLVVVGCLIALSEGFSVITLIFGMFGAWLVWRGFSLKKSTTYTLILRNSSGESPALVSKNGPEIHAVHKAITDAMVYRG